MTITIYTDGAVTKQGVGGWAYVALDLGVEKAGKVEPATNNTMELQAAIEAMLAYRNADLIIISDSQYLVNGANSWVYTWEQRGWLTGEGKPVANQEQWETIMRLKEGRVVQFKWVKGHATNEGNIRADELASSICRPKTNWGTHADKESGMQVNVMRQQKCTYKGENMVIIAAQDGWWNVISKHDFKKNFEKLANEEATDTGSA